MSDKDATNRPVAVIGLGSMGLGVARSLLRADIRTRGYDLNPVALAAFAEAGGHAARDPADAVAGVEILVLMLVSAEQCDSILFGDDGVAERLPAGSIVVLASTTPADYAMALERKLAARELYLIDAPVSGGAAKAQSGELSIMAAGHPDAFARCAALFTAVSSKVYHIGDSAGAGQSVKMINQLLAGVHIAAAAEAMALGIKAGLDPKMVYEIISNSAGASWMFQNRVPHILAGDYAPKSMVDIFVKDLGIVLDAGLRLHFPLPVAASAHQQFLSASAAGYGREDDAAVIKVYPGIVLPGQE